MCIFGDRRIDLKYYTSHLKAVHDRLACIIGLHDRTMVLFIGLHDCITRVGNGSFMIALVDRV